jgi:hypothetical protein
MTLGSDATGDVYYRDASGFLERLGASTDGYVLTTGGAGTVPAWEAVPAGTITALNNQTADRLVSIGSTTTELDGEANLTFDGSTLNVVGNAGVGIARTDGTLHVHTATAGSVTPTTGADDLVVENSGPGGISILTPDANGGTLAFGSPSDNDYATIWSYYNSGSPTMNFSVNASDRMTIDSDGNVTKTNNACFLVRDDTSETDVTGDGTVYTVPWDTEVFDQGANFASNTFTAPVTGRYMLVASVPIGSTISSSHTTGQTVIVTSNRSYRVYYNPYTMAAGGANYANPVVSMIADMDASDTAYVQTLVSGGDKTVHTSAVTDARFFSGCLIS